MRPLSDCLQALRHDGFCPFGCPKNADNDSEGKPTPKKQRWAVLKGNLLFYFRDASGGDIVGCIVLEKLALKVIDDKSFEFKLGK